jgi:Holliday junction resolvase RusA-like endonuclease
MTRKGFAYTPAATRKYEAHARLAAQDAMADRPPLDVPVRIELLVELPVPASWSKRKAEAAITGDVRPTSRPDIDNYVKSRRQRGSHPGEGAESAGQSCTRN